MSGMSEVSVADREGRHIFYPLGYLLLLVIVSDTSSMAATIEEVLCKFYVYLHNYA
jgi:hypothetical protein